MVRIKGFQVCFCLAPPNRKSGQKGMEWGGSGFKEDVGSGVWEGLEEMRVDALELAE